MSSKQLYRTRMRVNNKLRTKFNQTNSVCCTTNGL